METEANDRFELDPRRRSTGFLSLLDLKRKGGSSSHGTIELFQICDFTSDHNVEKAYESVINGEYEWAMFGYSGKRKIKYLHSGKKCSEVPKHILDTKILYIFIRFGSQKFGLVTWLGDKVEESKKSKVIKHKKSIKSFFKAANWEYMVSSVDGLERCLVPEVASPSPPRSLLPTKVPSGENLGRSYSIIGPIGSSASARSVTVAMSEIHEMRRGVEGMQSKMARLEAEKIEMEQRIRDLERKIGSGQERIEEITIRSQKKDGIIARLQNDLANSYHRERETLTKWLESLNNNESGEKDFENIKQIMIQEHEVISQMRTLISSTNSN